MKDKIIELLNAMLISDKTNYENAYQAINHAKDVLNCKYKFIDLVNEFTEEALNYAQKEKIEGIKSQNFDWAVRWRDRFDELKKYLQLKKELDVNKSQFVFYDGEIIFLCFRKNNQYLIIEECIKELGK